MDYRGKYCDDVALPARLETQFDYLEPCQEIAFAASWVEAEILEPPAETQRVTRDADLPDRCIAPSLLFSNPIVQSSVMMRRSLIPEDGYRDLDPAEDYDLWDRISLQHPCALIRLPLVLYRVHPSNVTARRLAVQEAQIRRINEGQLERLGIRPSNDQWQLHRAIGLQRLSGDYRSFVRAEKWLSLILRRNREVGIYDRDALEEVVGTIWWYLIRNLRERRALGAVTTMRSSLSRGKRASLLGDGLRSLGRRFGRTAKPVKP